MHYVYILRSQSRPDCYYVGLTSDHKRRIQAHNSGASRHTEKLRPWTLKAYIAFKNRSKAFRFERYLKSGSGREFAKRLF